MLRSTLALRSAARQAGRAPVAARTGPKAGARFASTAPLRAANDNEVTPAMWFAALATVGGAVAAYYWFPHRTSHETKHEAPAGPAVAVPATNAPKPDFPRQDPNLDNAPANAVRLPKSPSDNPKMNASEPTTAAPDSPQLDASPAAQDSPAQAAQTGRSEEPSSPEEVFGPGAAASYQIPYVLIGGGTACHFAMKAILEKDPNAKIVIITEDVHRPYARPPLSKEAWADPATSTAHPDAFVFHIDGSERRLHYEEPASYLSVPELQAKGHGVALMAQRRVADFDPFMKKIVLDNNVVVYYDKCLLAPGGTPRTLKVFDEADAAVRERVDLYRSVEDFFSVDAAVRKGKRIAVIGGGFLGSELSAAIAERGRDHGLQVEHIMREPGPLRRVLPPYLSDWVAEELKQDGVHVHTNCQVESASATEKGVRLGLSNGQSMEVDHVVVAVGIEPRTDLAGSARLEIDSARGGIVANAELQARSDLWVAGDAVSFFDISLGRRRVEHHDHAALTGRLAGQNMTGARRPFFDQSMLWSDIGSRVSLEAIGTTDATLQTVSVWAQPPDGARKYHKGVVFYVKDKRVVGVLLWNVPRGIPAARKILRSEKQFENVRDLARFFRLYDEASA